MEPKEIDKVVGYGNEVVCRCSRCGELFSRENQSVDGDICKWCYDDDEEE